MPLLEALEYERAPVPRIALAAWLIFFSLFLYQLARGTGVFFLMDNVFVPIHEGGHLLFRFLGTTISVAGGTFLQLFVPLALAVYFVFQRQAQGVAFCMFFFFEQFLPVATYMADARAQELPLLTVGDSEDVIHDWNYLFTKMGLLRHDTQIAAVVRFIGWIGMISVTLWLLRRGLSNKAEPSAHSGIVWNPSIFLHLSTHPICVCRGDSHAAIFRNYTCYWRSTLPADGSFHDWAANRRQRPKQLSRVPGFS